MAQRNALTEALDKFKQLTQKAGNVAGSAINQVSNLRYSPNTPTLGQSVQNTFSKPENWFLPSALAAGKGVGGSNFNIPNVTKPVGQFALGFGEGSTTAGIVNFGSKPAPGLEQTARDVGKYTGMFMPYSIPSRLVGGPGTLFKTAVTGAPVNVALQGVMNKFQGKDFLNNASQSAKEGFDISAQLAPLGVVTNKIAGPLLNKIYNPGTAQTMFSGGKQIPFAMQGAKQLLKYLTREGLADAIPYAGLETYKAPQDKKLETGAMTFAQAFLLGTGTRVVGLGTGKVYNGGKEIIADLKKMDPPTRRKFLQGGFVNFDAMRGKDQGKNKESNLPKKPVVNQTINDVGANVVKDSTQLLPQGEPKLTRQSQKVLQNIDKGLQKPEQLPGATLDTATSKYYNTGKMGVTPKAKNLTQATIDSPQVQSQINEIGGPKLTFNEVKAGTKVSPELNKTFTRESAQQLGEESLALRNKIAALSESGADPQQFQEALVKDKAFGMYVARLLGQRRIASNPADKTIFNKIIGAVLKAGHDPEEVAKVAGKVNFDNPTEATAFYRQYIKATKGDWMDAVRYSSMLSSPNTHINNASSNLQGTGIVAPIEKTISGGIDFLKATGAKALGKNYQREHFVGEGGQYAQGYWSNVGNAAHKFADVMTGKSLSNMQELHNIPMTTGGPARAVENVLTFPGKLLQASDEFFQTLTEAGAKKALEYRAAKGGKVPGDIAGTAYKEGRKRLFNAEFNLPEEGPILKALEFIPQKVMEARSSKNPVISTVAKYTFPFVRIPSNLLKGSVEYSPLGLSTIPGATNKTEQLSKAIMGSSIGLGAAMLVATDRLTWSEPTDATKRAAFRAAGLQPYAVKIGDNWVSYAKMHPVVGFNLALVAAVRDAQQNKRLDDSQVETVLNGVAQWASYYADASYVKNIGDAVSSAKGDLSAPSRLIGNYVQQNIPYRALMGWITRIVDPVQRKADPNGNILQKQLQQISTQIPGLSSTVPAALGPDGQPIKNTNNIINSFSPAKITTENPAMKQEYTKLVEKSQQTKLESDLRDRVRSQGGIQQNGDKIFYKTKDKLGKETIQSLDLTQPAEGFDTKYGVNGRGANIIKNSQIMDPNSSITKQQAVDLLKQIKADPNLSYGLAQKAQAIAQRKVSTTAAKVNLFLSQQAPDKRKEYIKRLRDDGILTDEVIRAMQSP